MPETSPSRLATADDRANVRPDESFSTRLKVFNYSGIFLAVLQSACSAFVALSGIRLLVGVGAFAFAAGALRFADRVHLDAIRIPMMLLALAGSLINLFVIWRIRNLRNKPASQWRQKPVPASKLRAEKFQIALSLLTLALLAAEWITHPMVHRVP